MSTKTIRLAATMIATSVAAAAAAAPASATTLACDFTVTLQNISPGIMLTGGSGTYTIGSVPQGTDCSLNGASSQDSIIRSIGSFTNIVCGTGDYRSQWRQRSSEHTSIDYGADGLGSGLGPDLREVEYTIRFTGLTGQINVETVGTSPLAAQPETLPANGHATVIGGLVPACASPTGATSVTWRGHLVVNWSGIP